MLIWYSAFVLISWTACHVDAVRPENPPSEGNPNIIEGDILISDSEDLESIRQGSKSGLWEKVNGSVKVTYFIADYEEGDFEHTTIMKAVHEWNTRLKGCFEFVNHTLGEPRPPHFLRIINGKGCYSRVGISPSVSQILSLSPGCMKITSILHEFGHIAGFIHEHNRSDRDEYVEVLWNNIKPSYRGEFYKVRPDDYVNIGEYDYYSVMHYTQYAVTVGRNRTFNILKDGIDEDRIGRGENDSLSAQDVVKIKTLYECN